MIDPVSNSIPQLVTSIDTEMKRYSEILRVRLPALLVEFKHNSISRVFTFPVQMYILTV